MTLETNNYRVNDEGNRIAREAGCGWTGIPQFDGTFLVTFFDEDADGFEWELALIFAPDEQGQPFTNSSTSTLSETSVLVQNEGKPVAHNARYQVEELEDFEDVLKVVRELQSVKPPVSALKSAKNTVTEKIKSSGMGSPAEIKDLISKKLGSK